MGQEPVGLGKVPSFLVSKKSEVVCKFCGDGVSSLKEMVEHWKEEGGRKRLVDSTIVGMEKVPHAEVVMVATERKEVEKYQDSEDKDFEVGKAQEFGENQEEREKRFEMKEKVQRDNLQEMEIESSQLLLEETRVEPRSEGAENLGIEMVEIEKADNQQELLKEIQ